jgi:hypothetical protein
LVFDPEERIFMAEKDMNFAREAKEEEMTKGEIFLAPAEGFRSHIWG